MRQPQDQSAEVVQPRDTTCHDLTDSYLIATRRFFGMRLGGGSADNTDMTPPFRERRKYRRRPVLLNCRIEGAAVAGQAQLTDLSENGCFIATSSPFTRDSQIAFFVTLEDDEIRIIGRVIRVQPGRGVGVEINVSLLSQYARLALEDFLRQSSALDNGRG